MKVLSEIAFCHLYSKKVRNAFFGKAKNNLSGNILKINFSKAMEPQELNSKLLTHICVCSIDNIVNIYWRLGIEYCFHCNVVQSWYWKKKNQKNGNVCIFTEYDSKIISIWYGSFPLSQSIVENILQNISSLYWWYLSQIDRNSGANTSNRLYNLIDRMGHILNAI